MKFILRLFVILAFSNILFGNEQWIIKEEYLSPAIEHFDCHSSSIVETSPGNFCAVWKGGPGTGRSNVEIRKNVGIWVSVFDGSVWSSPREIVTVPHSVCWTPVVCKAPMGELLLFYRVGPNPRNVVGMIKRSTDGGSTWSEEEILPAGIIGPTQCKPLFTPEGVLIAPSSIEAGEYDDLFKATACWIEISPDLGQTWQKIGPIEHPERKFSVITPALFPDQEGNIKMYCRDRAKKVGETGYIWSSTSQDQGLTWSALEKTSLPNPDSGIDIVDLENGALALLYNHSHTSRECLHIALSQDGGDTWTDPHLLSLIGEFPSGTLASDGMIHITYAISEPQSVQRRIKHVVVDPTLLSESH